MRLFAAFRQALLLLSQVIEISIALCFLVACYAENQGIYLLFWLLDGTILNIRRSDFRARRTAVAGHGMDEIPAVFEVTREDGYCISDARQMLDIEFIHRYLADEAYWSAGLPRQTLERALSGSLPFGIYDGDGVQVGFARVVTDGAIFAYLRDVFVVEAHRGRGLATWLARVMQTHPALADVRSWLLATRDAHEVYRRAGFESVPHPEWYMRIRK